MTRRLSEKRSRLGFHSKRVETSIGSCDRFFEINLRFGSFFLDKEVQGLFCYFAMVTASSEGGWCGCFNLSFMFLNILHSELVLGEMI